MLQQLCSPNPTSKLLILCRQLYPNAQWAFGQVMEQKRHWRSCSVSWVLIAKIERYWPNTTLPTNVHVFPIEGKKSTIPSLVVLMIDTLSMGEQRVLRQFFAAYAQRLEQERHYRQLEWAQYTDPLTGLFNRRAFEKHYRELWLFQSRYSQQKMGLMVIDVNGLKQINDTYGHLIGDELLQRTSVWLQQICEKTDAIFRIGGDEFVVLLRHGSVANCKLLGQRLTEKKWADFSGMGQPIGVSFGWASTELHELNQLFNIADRNMYQQKRRYYKQFYQKQ